jgi:truncated hemoglobin YjbI
MVSGPPSPLLAKCPNRTSGPEAADTDVIIGGPPSVPSASGQVDSVRDWLMHYTRGRYSWADAVAQFYQRAAADPQIESYFHDVELADLQRHFTAAIAMVTSKGLSAKTVIRMAEVHAGVRNRDGQPITGEVYDKTIGVLAAVLTNMGVPQPAINDLASVVAPLRRAIVVEPVTR